MLRTRSGRYVMAAASLVAVLMASAEGAGASASHPTKGGSPNTYRVVKLVSDVPGRAANLDPNLVNAWGLAAGPTTPWWVADNGTNVSTLYSGSGAVIPLVVAVGGAPTGAVFNGGPNFVVNRGRFSGPALFIFSTESGRIRAWSPSVPPPAPSTRSFVVVNNSGVGAVYKGLALASTSSGDFLYATDFHNGRVDVFDGNFAPVTTPGAFVDPMLPPHFAPFGIRDIDGTIVVTYAKQDADARDDSPGLGHGFVDMFDTSGTFLGRVATRGPLDSPWGLAVAPASFGRFEGDLLVGNFGDGQINAYELRSEGTYEHAGTLRRGNGSVLAIDGLWALSFGNGGAAGPKSALFFTAGPDGEGHGLFGKIGAPR